MGRPTKSTRITLREIDEIARLHRAAEARARSIYEGRHGNGAISRRDIAEMGLDPLPDEENGLPPGSDTAP